MPTADSNHKKDPSSLRSLPFEVRRLFWVCSASIVIVGSIVSAELACQIAYRVSEGAWLFLKDAEPPNGAFDRHPYLVGVPRPNFDSKIIKHNAVGHRGADVTRPKKKGVKRILALGGSSTYGTGLSEENTWPALLQRELGEGCEVVNLGVPGYSSVENLIQTALIISDLEPDVALYYEGWNDLRSAHIKDLEPDYSNFHPRGLYSSLYLSPVIPPHKSAILYFLRTRLFDSSWQDPLSKFELEPGPAALTDQVDMRALALYERNLRSIAALDRSMAITPVFIPQVLNYAKFTDDKPYGWMPYVRDKDVQKFMKAYNTSMQRIALELNVPFISEVLTTSFSNGDFMDNGHFNDTGAARFAKIVAAFLKNHPSLR